MPTRNPGITEYGWDTPRTRKKAATGTHTTGTMAGCTWVKNSGHRRGTAGWGRLPGPRHHESLSFYFSVITQTPVHASWGGEASRLLHFRAYEAAAGSTIEISSKIRLASGKCPA